MQRKIKVYIAFTVVILAMGFLVMSGFNQETMLYYTTVKELKAKGPEAREQGFRVAGRVLPGTVVKSSDHLQVAFDIEEEGEVLRVVYKGILPDTFKENTEVLLEGRYLPTQEFQATNVLTKCASKYDPSETGTVEHKADYRSGT